MPMAIIPGNTTGIPNMIILTNGNVGIGISKPSTLLCVNGTSTLNDHVGFNTPPATYGLTVPTINATTSITSPSIIFGATELSTTLGNDLMKSGGIMTGGLTVPTINTTTSNCPQSHLQV
jgi:hypothetical protein